MLNRALVPLLSFSLLAACGGKGGSGSGSGSGAAEKLTPLTPDQKQKVATVTDSVNNAQGAADKRASGLGPKPIAFSQPAAASEKTRELGQKLQEANCQFDDTRPDKDAKIGSGSFHLTVGGPNCPIRMTMAQTFETKVTNASMDKREEQTMTYAVLDPTYARLNDVTAFDMKGSVTNHADQNGNGASGSFSGNIDSQQYGKVAVLITVEGSANRQGGSFTSTRELKFTDFRAVGRMVQKFADGKEEDTYFLNDQPVSKKEFAETFRDNQD